MQLSSLNGTRFGTFVQTILFLTGVPSIIDHSRDREVSTKQGGRSGLNLDTLSPNPHPDDPLNVKCYGVLGCFRVKYPLERGFHLFPEPIKIIKPNICLQVHQDRTCQAVDAETIPTLLLSPGPKSFWITHGYIDTGHKPWTQKLATELLEYDNSCNVYIIDWGRGAEPPYSQAAVNVELLGAYIGHLMTLIQDVHGLSINETHFIGHSLGAHFGGFTGSWLNEQGFQLGRISGLDPAQPYFQEFQPDVRLDPTDALFVDVIHTDAKPLLAGGSLTGLGTQEPSGHVDFYPNNGKEQPGCTDGVYQAILQEKGSLLYGLRRFFGCDHIRSYEIFIESVRSPCLFLSFACSDWDSFLSGSCSPVCEDDSTLESCNRMGFHARKPRNVFQGIVQRRQGAGTGNDFEKTSQVHNETLSVFSQPSKIYFAITGNRSPYCREHYRVSLELGSKSLSRTNSDLNLLILGEHGVLDKVKLGARDLRDSVSFQYLVPGHGFKGSVEKVILKPTVTNPIWWLVNKMVRNPEIRITSISIHNMETRREFVLCPSGPPFLRMSEENNNVLLTSSACFSSLPNSSHSLFLN